MIVYIVTTNCPSYLQQGKKKGRMNCLALSMRMLLIMHLYDNVTMMYSYRLIAFVIQVGLMTGRLSESEMQGR